VTPFPQNRIAFGALCRCQVGLVRRELLGRRRPLSVRHLPNHERTRGNLLAHVLESGSARRAVSVSRRRLHHRSLGGVPGIGVKPARDDLALEPVGRRHSRRQAAAAPFRSLPSRGGRLFEAPMPPGVRPPAPQSEPGWPRSRDPSCRPAPGRPPDRRPGDRPASSSPDDAPSCPCSREPTSVAQP
jgi:hypothetical protein